MLCRICQNNTHKCKVLASLFCVCINYKQLKCAAIASWISFVVHSFQLDLGFYGATSKMSEYIDIAKIGERIYDLEKPKKFEKIFSGGFHWMNHSYKLLLEDISVRTLLKGSFDVFSGHFFDSKSTIAALRFEILLTRVVHTATPHTNNSLFLSFLSFRRT